MRERDEVKLPARIETLLGHWPDPPRDEADWEALASRIERAAQGAQDLDAPSALTDDELFAPPLPREEGEGALLVRVRRNTPGSRSKSPSLAALAKAQLGNANERDIQVAKETLSHAARSRASGEAAHSVARAAESAEVDLTRLRAARGKAERELAQQESPIASIPDRRSAWLRGAVIGAGVALIAAAAAFLLAPRPGQDFVPGANNDPQATKSVPKAPQTPAQHPPRQPTGVPPEQPERFSRVDDLPGAPAASTGAELAVADGKPRGQKPHPGGASAPKVAPVMSGPSEWDQKLQAAEGRPMPLEPSQGELSAALGKGVQAARFCMAGQAEPASITVTFGSNGKVKAVGVSGPAAGTPAETCIQSAFQQSNLQPFAKPTFTVGGLRLSP